MSFLKRKVPVPGVAFSKGLERRKELKPSPLKKESKKHAALKPGDRKVTAMVKDAECARCGVLGCEPDHITSRRVKSLRHHELNILPMCRTCHDWRHQNPAEFDVWFDRMFPGRREELLEIEAAKSKRFRESA